MGCHGKLCPADAGNNGSRSVSSHWLVCAPRQHTSSMVTAVYQNNLLGDGTVQFPPPPLAPMGRTIIWFPEFPFQVVARKHLHSSVDGAISKRDQARWRHKNHHCLQDKRYAEVTLERATSVSAYLPVSSPRDGRNGESLLLLSQTSIRDGAWQAEEAAITRFPIYCTAH